MIPTPNTFSPSGKSVLVTLWVALLALIGAGAAPGQSSAKMVKPQGAIEASSDLHIESAAVRYLADLDLLVFEQRVAGTAGATLPRARGSVDGAPVLGYVFPTSLRSVDVGFAEVEGVVALAVTSHPDFDDTPLWDENNNRDYADDGVIYHPHWVVLVPDQRVAGGLAVRSTGHAELAEVLPPTNPGMPMYMDSPGFSVVLDGDTLRVLVPAQRLGGRKDFNFDAVAAYMEVAASGAEAGTAPMLGVYQVYSVLSGDLSLPYKVKTEK